jgi:hypothetical protein
MRRSIRFKNRNSHLHRGSAGRLWHPVLLWLSLLIFPAPAVIARPAADGAEANAPAVLRIGNRDVTTFRAAQ